MDTLTKAKRSWVMGRIKGKNTKPEIAIRSALSRMGCRYRLHRKDLPGKPDIAISSRALGKLKLAVFVNGCFWHGHAGCRKASRPKTNVAFWRNKISGNRARDRKTAGKLKAGGWAILTIWECEIPKDRAGTIRMLLEKLRPLWA